MEQRRFHRCVKKYHSAKFYIVHLPCFISNVPALPPGRVPSRFHTPKLQFPASAPSPPGSNADCGPLSPAPTLRVLFNKYQSLTKTENIPFPFFLILFCLVVSPMVSLPALLPVPLSVLRWRSPSAAPNR